MRSFGEAAAQVESDKPHAHVCPVCNVKWYHGNTKCDRPGPRVCPSVACIDAFRARQ